MERRIVPVVLALLVTLLSVSAALAQQPTAREQELLKRIDALEKRLGDLEKKSAEKPATAQKPEKKAGDDLRAYWKDGLKFDSASGDVKLAIGALIQDDWAQITQDGPATADSRGGTEFRRARLSVSGTVRDKVEFKAEYDFAGTSAVPGTAAFKDVWVGLKGIPYVGTIRAGRFKEPFSLDELTSDSWVTFMERGLPNAFAPSRQTGLQLQNNCLDQRMTWAAGVFHITNDYGFGTGQNLSLTGRVTGLPFAKSDDQFLHLGAALSLRNPQDDTVSFSARPEAHLAPKLTNTGSIAADSVTLFGAEAAAEWKRASLQAEYMLADVDPSAPGDRVNLSGYYIQGSYFLTGEHRPYNRATAVFDRPIPRHNFLDGKGGWGAWEVAARYSALDLSDATLAGGKMNDWTLGVNWYLNPVTRCSLNYVISNADAKPDDHVLEMRTQLSF